MYFYSLYGMCLQTDKPLSGLRSAPATSTPHWIIHIVGAGELPGGWRSSHWDDTLIDSVDKIVLSSIVSEEGFLTYNFRVGLEDNPIDVLVAFTHRHIWVSWQHETAETAMLDAVSDLLSQIVLSYLLRLEGNYVLHAAAVAQGTEAFLLIAKSGTGKSSLTLALATAGMHVLSEETAVLQKVGQDFWVQPGSARLRLFPATLEAMSIAPDALTLVSQKEQKRYLPLTQVGQQPEGCLRQAASPARLTRIYWLQGRDPALHTPRIEPMRPADATMMLLRNRYHPFPVGAERVAGEFRQAIQMAEQLSLRKVQLPDCLQRLQESASALRHDFEHLL